MKTHTAKAVLFSLIFALGCAPLATSEEETPAANIQSLEFKTLGTPYNEPTGPNSPNPFAEPFGKTPGYPPDFRPDPNQIDWDGDGFLPSDGDCDNFNPDIGPGYFDYCDGLNNDCDDEVDEDLICDTTCVTDVDCLPFITECIDAECSEGSCFVYLRDDDGDGWSRCGIDGREPPDCNENNLFVNPGTMELCDGIDNNCNREIDEGCPACDPIPEVCDGVDNDCDGAIDEEYQLPTECETDNDCSAPLHNDSCSRYGRDSECLVFRCLTNHCYAYYRDEDNDGYNLCADLADPVGHYYDCDDSDPVIYPGAQELCFDDIDNDCDSEVDEDCEEDDDDCRGHQRQHGHGHHHHGHGHGRGHDCD